MMKEAELIVASAPAAIVQEHRDHEAEKIGAEYKKGEKAYRATGLLLIEQKAKLKLRNEAWMSWVEANEKTLGFTYVTATRLMKHCKDKEWKPEIVWGHKSNPEEANKSQAQDLSEAQEPQSDDDAKGASKIVIECDGALLQNEVVIKHARNLLHTLKESERELTKEEVTAICARVARGWGRGRPSSR